MYEPPQSSPHPVLHTFDPSVDESTAETFVDTTVYFRVRLIMEFRSVLMDPSDTAESKRLLIKSVCR
jgi:hypothetical protein